MAFDPSKFGATSVNTFNPSSYGATPSASPSINQQSPSESIWASLASGAGKVGNFVLGGASDLGTHLGEGAAILTGKAATAITGDNSLENKVYSRLQQPQTNIFGAPIKPLQSGMAGAEQIGGDVLKTGAEFGAVAAAPATLPAIVGTGVGIGAAQGAGEAMQNDKGLKDIAIGGGIGGAVGGATAGALGTAGTLLSKLPSRLIQSALPKLEAGNIPKVLNDTKLGTIHGLLNDSKNAVSEMGNSIQNILKSDGYASHVGNGSQSIDDTLHSFSQSEYTRNDIVGAAKSVVPQYARLVTKLDQGTATLAEKNELRQAIDQATKKIFTDSPQVSAQKQIAAGLASELRHEVQSVAPETKSIFANLSKEINLRNALNFTAKKGDKRSPINLFSILSYATGGLPAAFGEEFARSPAVSIATGKAANALAPLAKGLATPTSSLTSRFAADSSNKSNQ